MATLADRSLTGLALLCGALCSVLCAQTSNAPSACVEQLAIPQFPQSARSAGISETVNVVVTWANKSVVHWLIESKMPHFRPAVEVALKQSKFAESCPGGSLNITFDFSVSTSRRRVFKQEVTFMPPFRFRISTDLMELNP